jgi:catechol 2,3-dioxygenase-like lactoylglutathione lyase family enzyme
MTGTPHSHVGFLVENLEAAMARFTEVLGVTFNEPREVYFDHLHDPEPRQTMIRIAFSKEGPPHYELIEGDRAGMYALDAGEGIHHVGVWEPDAEHRMEALMARGVAVEARVMLSDGSLLTWFNDPADLHGVRVEFVDDADRPTFEHFMKTGEFEGEMRL